MGSTPTNHDNTGGRVTPLSSSFSSLNLRTGGASLSRSLSHGGVPCRLRGPSHLSRSRSLGGEAGRWRFDGGPNSLDRPSSRLLLVWSGVEARFEELIVGRDWFWLACWLDRDCSVSVRPRLELLPLDWLEPDPPDPCLESTKPRSLTAIVSVPRYL